jgi:tetratricopeptide (TPR) repeat protein
MDDFLRSLGVSGADIPKDLAGLTRLYRAITGDGRYLIILDNAHDERQVRDLWPGNPACAMLVTSRSPLGGLGSATRISLGALNEDQAVQLLDTLTQHKRAADEPEAARAIVKFCDYLPLAIRPAAAKLNNLPHLTLERLAKRLEDERGRLQELGREVQASFRVACEQLSTLQQRAFRLSACINAPDFPSWLTAALLEIELDQAEKLLEGIVELHLLDITEVDRICGPRYRFHELIRLYALEEFGDKESVEEQHAALQRVLATNLHLSNQADAKLTFRLRRPIEITHSSWRPHPSIDTVIGDAPMHWFAANRIGLVTAVHDAYRAKYWDLAWQQADALVDFFSLRADWVDWERTHVDALRAARRVRDLHGQATIFRNLGRLYWDWGRWSLALAYYDQSLPLFRQLGDRRGEAMVLHSFGDVYRDQGRFVKAVERLDQCLPLFMELDDSWWQAATIADVGIVYRNQGSWDDAITCLTLSMRVLEEEFGDRRWAARVRNSLGEVYCERGQFDEAREHITACQQTFHELSDLRWEMRTDINLGLIQLGLGEWRAAQEAFRKCRSYFSTIEDQRWEAITLHHLGQIGRAVRQWQEAIPHFEKCLQMSESVGDYHWTARARYGLGMTLREMGELSMAAEQFQQCLSVFQALPVPYLEAQTDRHLREIQGVSNADIVSTTTHLPQEGVSSQEWPATIPEHVLAWIGQHEQRYGS